MSRLLRFRDDTLDLDKLYHVCKDLPSVERDRKELHNIDAKEFPVYIDDKPNHPEDTGEVLLLECHGKSLVLAGKCRARHQLKLAGFIVGKVVPLSLFKRMRIKKSSLAKTKDRQ